jgi:hypothetical protein
MKRLVLVVLVGCGGGGGSSGGPISIDKLGDEEAQVACSKIFECCNSTEVMQQFMNITVNGQPITTEMQCESFYGGLLDNYLVPDYKASIAAGRVSYNADAARACFDAFVNLGCSAYSQLSGAQSVACTTPYLTPNVGDGGACAQDYECTSDYCPGGGSGATASGTCTPKPTSGQACSGTCAQGLYCNGTCQALLANGQSCSSNTWCASNYCGSSICADRPPTCDGK